jgi:hypothetical protein
MFNLSIRELWRSSINLNVPCQVKLPRPSDLEKPREGRTKHLSTVEAGPEVTDRWKASIDSTKYSTRGLGI